MLDDDGISRRNVLAATAATTAAAAGFSGEAAATGSYDRVINLVKKGADPNGNDSITPYLRKYAGNDTLIKLPQGRYRMASQFRYTGFSNFGIVGDNATIVPDDYWGFDGISCFLLGTVDEPGRDLQVSGLDFDFTRNYTGTRTIQAQVSDGLHVSDIDVIGQHDSGEWGPALFDIVDPDGSGTVKGFRAPDGGARSENCPGNMAVGPTGCMVSQDHKGSIELVHLDIRGFPDNGLYAGNPSGTVHVIGGVYANSTVSNVRIGGNGSSVKWAQVRVNERSDKMTQPGIRLDQGTDLTVQGCEVDLSTPNGPAIEALNGVTSASITHTDVSLGPGVDPAIKVHSGAGRTEIEYVDIEADGAGHTIAIYGDGSADKVVLYGVSIDGNASGNGGYGAIYCNRDGAEFRYVYVHQPGGNHRRAIDIRGDDCLIYKGRYVAREYSIINYGAGTRVIDSYAAVYDDTVSLLTYTSDMKLVRTTLENGWYNEDSGHITAYGNKTV